jgi:hypothetical protein
MQVDLESVDGRGRLDVLVYKLLEVFTHNTETKYGVSGIWDAVKPHANKLVAQHVGNDIPVAGQVLLEIIKANYTKGIL